MKSQTNLYYLTLNLKTNSLPNRRWNQTIAALSVPDTHQMCCVMISLEILVIIKYSSTKYSSTNSQYCSWSIDVQSTLSTVGNCNAILLWITKPAELLGTILLRSGPSTRCALVTPEYVTVYAVSSLLRMSQDVVRHETLFQKNLFSKQLVNN